MRRAALLLPAAALLLMPPAAPAAELPLWELGLGVGALSLPHYRGAEKSRNWLLPVPYGVYRGEILQADREGLKAKLLDSDRIDFDISLEATAPSRSADEPARQGMPDLKGTVEVGPNLNLRLAGGPGWKVEARLPVRAAFTLQTKSRGIGWVAAPSLNLDQRIAGWNIGTELAALWGSRDFHRYYYDVAPQYATAARPAYQARAGRGGWQATLAATRRDGRRWLGAFVSADSLAGASFTDSPLVRRRSNLTFGVAVSWLLWQSDRLVPDPDELR
ncbi:MAG: MipA/OmpV family protein [Rubrivivax sp.]